MNIFSKKGLFKMNYNLNPLLQNRVVLYVFFFLAIADLFYLANLRDFTTVTIIVLTGFLTSFFSKNMIVILCVALSVGHVLKYGAGAREGATTMADSKDTEIDGEPKGTNDKEESKVSKDLKVSKGTSSDEKKKAKDELMKGLKEFQSVQGDLMSGIEKLQPMLNKAESFIEKYETYKNIN